MSSSQRPSENSVLFSLRELRRIEDDRVKKEQDAARAKAESERQAKEAADRAAREAEERRIRDEVERTRRAQEDAEERQRQDQLRLKEAESRARVDGEMRIHEEESFGPVTTVVRVKGDEEAIRVANDTEYGLSAAVFSSNVQRALGVAARLESGICHINGPTVSDEAQMPFGGVKGSGYGRFGGKAAIAEFTDLRWITIEDPKQGYPF